MGPGRTAEMTYYETAAGAKVFAAGALNFGASVGDPVVARILDNLGRGSVGLDQSAQELVFCLIVEGALQVLRHPRHQFLPRPLLRRLDEPRAGRAHRTLGRS